MIFQETVSGTLACFWLKQKFVNYDNKAYQKDVQGATEKKKEIC